MSEEPATEDATSDEGEPGTGEPEIDWKAKARDWEKRAKVNSEKLKAAEPKIADYDKRLAESKSAEDRALETVKAAEARAAAANQRAARAEVGAALAGVVDDPKAIIEDLDMGKFVDADGDVDEAAVAKLRDKYAKFGNPRSPRPDPSQASAANGKSKADPAREFASFIQGQLNRS